MFLAGTSRNQAPGGRAYVSVTETLSYLSEPDIRTLELRMRI